LNDEASVRAEAVALREATGALAQLVDEEVRAEQLGEELAEFERTIVALDARSSALAVSVRDSAASAKRLEVEVETARRSQAELPGLEAAVRSAGERLTAGRRRDERTTQLLDQEDMLRHRVDEAQAARQQALDLREKRLLGFAAELAGTLLDGSPCGVCGSIAHPHPAEPRSDAVSEADELAAEAHAVATERRRAEGLALRTETEIGLAEARSLAGEHAVADLVAALAQAEAAHVTARESATARTAVEAKLRRVTGEQETQIQERISLDAEAQRLRDRTALVQEQLGSLRIQLASARGSDFSVRARMERIEGLATNCESLSDALKTAERVRRDLDDARSRAEIAAAAHGISELGTVAELVRDDGHLAELEEHRARHVGELTSVNEQLTDPVLQQAAAQPRADVRSLRVESERADAEHRRRLGDRHGAEQCAAALARLNRRLDGLVIDRAPLAAHHETVDHLSRLVEGKSADNRLRMSLAAYVLAARLEQVAAAASERLLTMSSGRYSLLHTDAVGTGRAVRGGLHLRVFDAWTGRDRDPTTLSGGESFAASLALALGLADVVTAEAGGSQLETLFVDEGFGSLDEETLDDVMGMLDNLRDGGRVIGIVSHVAELRQRIPTQLQILKGRRGSRIRQ
jgi:exonuclease SbcC